MRLSRLNIYWPKLRRLERSRWLRELLAILVLFSAITAFHWRGLQPGQTFIPVDLANHFVPWQQLLPPTLQNSLISDPLHQYYPLINSTTSLLRSEKQLPLWNPFVFSGHPNLADPLSQPFYPIMSLLSLWLGTARAFAIGLWLQICLAAVFTYGWLRLSGFSELPSLAGALVYALSGFLVTWFETTFWVSSIALFPAILCVFLAALRTKRIVFLMAAALLVSLAFLGGQVQFTITFLLWGGMYALGLTWIGWRQNKLWRWLPLIGFLYITLTGVLMASFFLAPFVEFTTLSHRFGSNAAPLTDRLPWQQLITLLIPDFFGNPTTSSGYRGYLPNYSEGTVYVGVVTLFLGCLTLLHKKRATTWLVLALTALAFYFILGGPGLSSLGKLPGFGFLTLHRTAFILPLFMAWLAAAALMLPALEKRTILLVIGLFFGALIISLSTATEYWLELDVAAGTTSIWLVVAALLASLRGRWPRLRSWFNLGFTLLIFADLFLWGHAYNPAGPVAELMPPTPGIAYLQRQVDPGQHRILVHQRHEQILIGLGNGLANFSLPVAGGNSSLVNNRYLQLAMADDPEIDIGWANKGNAIAYSFPSERLLAILGITHQVAARPLPYPDLQIELLQGDCSETIPNSGAGPPPGGTFVPQSSAINRLDVTLRDLAADSSATLRAQLWQEGESPRLVLDEEIEIVRDAEQETVTFFFAPERDAPGKQYRWSLWLHPGMSDAAICADKQGKAAIAIYGSTWSSSYSAEFHVYERLPVLAKAYVVYAAETIPDDNEAIARLLDPTFSVGSRAITATTVELDNEPPAPASTVLISSYRSDQIVMSATLKQPGLLILRDQYHPGWKAIVNGQERPVLRVNHIFRGVMLSPGTHEVILNFRPDSLRIGLAISSLGLFLLVGGAIGLKAGLARFAADGADYPPHDNDMNG